METLQNIIDQTQVPILTAFVLGLMTALSPCPMATNITAIGFIGKDIEKRKNVFINGLIYTAGRAFTYTGLGVILFFGASQFKIASFFQQYGERFLGPLLILIGIFMLDFISLKFSLFNKLQESVEKKAESGKRWSVFLLGVVFALAFCPYSGILYFGMLIPITISSADGLYLPLVFALGTGLPVLILAWIIAFAMSSIGQVYNKLKTFELWFRRIAAVVFILAGLYYSYIFYF
jgi:cytochrome c-type biogenesis protein